MPASLLAHVVMLAVFCLYELIVGCVYLYATCNGAGTGFLLIPALIFGAGTIYHLCRSIASDTLE